jgi:peroxiredoxin Q/BCP
MAIALNTKAPDFMLADQNGTMHSLAEYTGRYILLYFYPKDDTEGCTIEACNFRDRLNELKSKNVQVLGVSADTVESHIKFAKKLQLNFPILSDTTKQVIEAYDVWKEKTMFGKKFMGIVRESFLINPEGIVVKHYEQVKSETHVEEVLQDIQAIQ